MIREINIFKYIYYNYFCKKIIRKGNGKLIPYKNSIINLEKNSRIILHDENLEIGTGKLRGSKTETFLRLRENSEWICKAYVQLSYGTTIELLCNSKFESEYFTMNSFSTIIVGNHISIGDDVMIARNVVIFDSDFHKIKYRYKDSKLKGSVHIGNHVWVGVNSTILKNVEIGDNSMIAAGTLVNKNVDENTIIGSVNGQKILNNDFLWER